MTGLWTPPSKTIGSKLAVMRAQSATTQGGVVPTDGPSAVYVPTTATDWTNLGIATPNSWWLFQEVSGSIDDQQTVSTDFDLTAGASPSYQQTVTGWAGKFVGLDETVAGQQFILSTLSYNTAIDSGAALCYARIDTGAPTTGWLIHMNGNHQGVGGGAQIIRLSGVGKVSLINNGVITDGTYTYENDGLVHPFLIVWNKTANTLSLYTDKDSISGVGSTYSNVTAKGFGGAGTADPASCKLRFGAWWYGANAETISQTTLTKLGWSLVY